MSRQKRGFTLIEIAIVLVVVGILLAGAVTGVMPALESSRISATNKKLDRIEVAILAYVIQNGCLPCPANGTQGTSATSGTQAVSANAGWSQGSTAYYGPNNSTNNQPCANGSAGSGCSSTAGVVPWNTLDLKDSDTVDAWQNRITYAVTSSLTITPGTSMARTSSTTYPDGTLSVYNNSGIGGTCNTGTLQTSAAAYVLVSHGKDRFEGFAAKDGTHVTGGPNTGSEAQICNNPLGSGPGPFHQDLARPIEGTSYFDDIVRFRTAPAIIQDCGKNACGNPS